MLVGTGTQAKKKTGRTLDQGLVLIIDDDLETRAASSELVADLDFWPVTMRNGLEALEFLRQGFRPVAILVDLYMPLMDGEAFCDALRDLPALAKTSRILVSADERAVSRVARCGAATFLQKPLKPEQLAEALRRAKEAAASGT